MKILNEDYYVVVCKKGNTILKEVVRDVWGNMSNVGESIMCGNYYAKLLQCKNTYALLQDAPTTIIQMMPLSQSRSLWLKQSTRLRDTKLSTRSLNMYINTYLGRSPYLMLGLLSVNTLQKACRMASDLQFHM